MSDYLVVVASAARARFFTLEPAEFPELESGPNLVDQGELLNPQARIPERELFADSKTGREGPLAAVPPTGMTITGSSTRMSRSGVFREKSLKKRG